MIKHFYRGSRSPFLRAFALFALTASLSSTTAHAQTLLGDWRLNEGFGNRATDSSGNGNNGVLLAPPHQPEWAPGRVGSGLYFDGNQSVVVPPSPVLEPATVSVEAWVRHLGYPGTASVAHIVAKGGAWGSSAASYALFSFGGLQFYVSSTAAVVKSPDAGPGVWDGAWHHIVGTYDGAAVRLFVDGSEIGHGSPMTQPILYGTVPPFDLSIGNYGDTDTFNYSYPFIGDIDEVKVYGRALSPCEITAAYLASRAVGKPAFDVLSTLEEAGVFSTFLSLLKESGLSAVIQQESAVTVFAPNDKAFAALPKGTLDAVRKDPAKLRELLGRHILRGRVATAKLADLSLPSRAVTNLNGTPIQSLFIACYPGGCNLGEDAAARIVRADAEAGNGFVDETDLVMFRPNFNPPAQFDLLIL
jgi:uncharacterized surface protein with fasciclin (FAS1) repeats